MTPRQSLRLIVALLILTGVIVWQLEPKTAAPSSRPLSIGPVIPGSCHYRCTLTGVTKPSLHIPCRQATAADIWPAYGHDGGRGSAAAGCIGALYTKWRYVPVAYGGRGLEMVFHAMGTPTTVYLEWAQSDYPGDWFRTFVGTTAIDAINANGDHVWSFDSGRDVGLGNWPALALGKLALNDDGLIALDPATGAAPGDTQTVQSSNDISGQLLGDAVTHLWYASNQTEWHRDGLYLEAISQFINGPTDHLGGPSRLAWTVLNDATAQCSNTMGDETGALAESGATLFFAPHYNGATKQHSGVYAFDPPNGGLLWFTPLNAQSAISAGSGLVFVVAGDKLIALQQRDGHQAWIQTLQGASAQAPVLVNDVVITSDSAGVHAFDVSSGTPRWSSARIAGAAVPLTTVNFGSPCSTGALVGSNRTIQTAQPSTSLVAAYGSQTLLVTATDGLHVLALSSGKTLWQGTVSGQRGRLRDPVLIGDTVYAVDDDGLLALASR